MNQNKILLLFALLLGTQSVIAQTEADKLLIGGSGSLTVSTQSLENSITLDFSPTVGFFVIDNLAFGGTLGLFHFKFGPTISNSYSVSPFGRYYFGAGNTKFFLHGQLGYVVQNFGSSGNDSKRTGFAARIGPGVTFFLTKSVAIEGALTYYRAGGGFDDSNFGIRFGMFGYIGENE